VRRHGSYIYEDFMPTEGTDVKVYAVGEEYAHAEVTCVSVYIYISTNIYIYMYVYICMYIYVYLYIHVCVYIYLYINMYV